MAPRSHHAGHRRSRWVYKPMLIVWVPTSLTPWSNTRPTTRLFLQLTYFQPHSGKPPFGLGPPQVASLRQDSQTEQSPGPEGPSTLFQQGGAV
jgi:hypothetical protein